MLALLTVLVWSLIARSWASDAAPQPMTSPSPSHSAPAETPTSTSTEGAGTPPVATDQTPPPAGDTPAAGTSACTAADLDVKAVTDAQSYDADVRPKLSISLTNKSAKDCTLNVGTSKQVFTIKSGEDVWWRSTDCQQNPSDAVQTIKAGATVTSSAPVEWDRTRSSVDTCGSADRQHAPGGGATYRLGVSIGGFPSGADASFILN